MRPLAVIPQHPRNQLSVEDIWVNKQILLYDALIAFDSSETVVHLIPSHWRSLILDELRMQGLKSNIADLKCFYRPKTVVPGCTSAEVPLL